ncbi:hypothetical protein EV126DRAFT_179061 [Verticillium dahliae]|nr:hypothetical protein EV126DRAFT_179061 [Verticillium dahliae]
MSNKMFNLKKLVLATLFTFSLAQEVDPLSSRAGKCPYTTVQPGSIRSHGDTQTYAISLLLRLGTGMERKTDTIQFSVDARPLKNDHYFLVHVHSLRPDEGNGLLLNHYDGFNTYGRPSQQWALEVGANNQNDNIFCVYIPNGIVKGEYVMYLIY